MNVKKLCRLALLTAVALTIFLVEAQIPELLPVPGVKLGLSNIVTVFVAFTMGPWEAVGVLSCRIFLGAVFSGRMSTLLYSAAGGALAIGVTILLRRVLTERHIWVAGCLGAIAHNLGQLLAAMAVTGTVQLVYYLPVLLVSAVVTGLFTGMAAQTLCKRWNRKESRNRPPAPYQQPRDSRDNKEENHGTDNRS